MAIKDNETEYPWIPAGVSPNFMALDSEILANGDIIVRANVYPAYTNELYYGGNVYDDTLRYAVIEKTNNIAKRITSGAIVQERALRYYSGSILMVSLSMGYYLLPGIADDAFSYEA